MSTVVEHSLTESEVLGLNISRCNTDFFDEQALKKQVIAGNYDICRLKVASEDELASLKLSRTGLPFYFSGSIRRYKTRILENPGEYVHPGLEFELYDGSQDLLLKDMLIDTWGDYPIGYYRTPFLHRLISKEIEIESVFRFYKKCNLQSNNPNNCILFIRDGDVYTGFFALNIVGNNLESHIGGILKPYQAGGYFSDMLRYIRDYCLDHRLENFVFGARNENATVQQIFQKEGFIARNTENVFHIASLLAHKENVAGEAINIVTQDEADVIYKKAIEKARSINPRLAVQSFSIVDIVEKSAGATHLSISVPVDMRDETLLVLKVRDSSGNLLKLAYLHCR